MLSRHLQDLNETQLEAVTYGDGPLLVFAGAGSGKTRVLTRRMANLIFEKKAYPEEIFAVTFTNKAAREMKERVCQIFDRSVLPLWVATFHSACVRILRRHAQLLDYTSNFVIYDSSDSLSAMKRVFKMLKVDAKVIDPKTVLHRIDYAKNNYLDPEQLYEATPRKDSLAQLMKEVYIEYQKELHKSNAMDFGDLICNTLNLFKLEGKVLERYQEQFKYLLVDEYQDTNPSQYLLVKSLSEKNKNICAVGDDDQSIYAFRGATIENILNFKRDFPNAHVVTLDINYRSTKSILKAASEIIAENEHRQKKDVYTLNPQGEKICVFCANDEKDEAEFVAKEISVLFNQGVEPCKIAIFYRTNAQSRALEETFISCGIKYEIFGGFRFYDRKEIKDVLAYFRLLLNPKDNDSLLRIINVPARGLGPTTVASLSAYAQKEGVSIFEGIKKALVERPRFLSEPLAKKLLQFVGLIDNLRDEAEETERCLRLDANERVSKTLCIAQLIMKIAERSGYLKKLKVEESEEAQSRIENINELARVAEEFVENTLDSEEPIALCDFLDRASLNSDLDNENVVHSDDGRRVAEKDYVSMMTLHLAKGLEFDYVFMVGLEEGLLPHSRSLELKADLEEERRLCYVGVTRAKQKLFLSHALSRRTFGRGSFYSGYSSRFLESIPHDLIEERGYYY